MISECLADIDKPTDLHKFYEEGLQVRLPYSCPDKRNAQNQNTQHHIMDAQPVLLNDVAGCEEVFNVRNLTSAGAGLQEGYSRNIDVDSELKRINHYRDACFYDNYKMHPNKMTPQQSRLACHSKFLVKDYDKHRHTKPSKCLNDSDFEKFEACPTIANGVDDRSQPVTYKFSNDNYCRNWPCQKLFHNQTKRSTVTNLKDCCDVNPQHLTCCNALRS